MTLRLGGDGAITGCTSLENPDLTVSGLTISGSFDAEKVLVASGTAAAPSYTFSGDTDNGLYYAGTNSIGLATAGTNAILIDSSNRVGIGTASPASLLDLQFANSRMRFEQETGSNRPVIRGTRTSDKANRGISFGGSDISFLIGSTSTTALTSADEKARIDSSGRLLVGTSSERTVEYTPGAAGTPKFQVEGNDGGSSQILITDTRFDGRHPQLAFAKTRNGAIVASDDLLGSIGFFGDDGTDTRTWGGRITCEVDGTPGVNNMPGRLVFSTTADGASSPTERMRIDSGGNVGIGGTPTVFTGQNHLSIHSPGSSTNVAGLDFYVSGTRESGMISYPSVGENLRIFGNTARVITIANNGSERMRIDSDGRLLVNRSTTATNGALAQFSSSVGPHISVNNTGASSAFMLFQNSTSGDAAGRGLYVGNDGSAAGYLWNYESGLYFGNNGATVGQFIGTKLNVPGVYSGTTTGGGPVYVESDGDLLRYTSSLKYKTDVETLEDARADAILNCRPVWYRSKCENDIKTEGAEKSDWGWYGFIAEEVAEIEPRLVNWATKDSVEQEDKTTLSVERDPADYEAEGVRYDNFVPLMLNLIKRQKAQIETLEAEVAALKAQ